MNRVTTRVQSAPILAVFAAVLVWSVGPIITLSVGVSINTTIFYRVIFWPPLLFAIAKLRKVPITKYVMKITFWPGVFFGLYNGADVASLTDWKTAVGLDSTEPPLKQINAFVGSELINGLTV